VIPDLSNDTLHEVFLFYEVVQTAPTRRCFQIGTLDFPNETQGAFCVIEQFRIIRLSNSRPLNTPKRLAAGASEFSVLSFE